MYLCVDIVSGSNPQIKTIAFWCFRSLLPLGLPLWSTFLVCFFFVEDQLWPFSNLSAWKRLLDRPFLKKIWGGNGEMSWQLLELYDPIQCLNMCIFQSRVQRKITKTPVSVHKWCNLFGCRIYQQRKMKIQVGISMPAPAKKRRCFPCASGNPIKKSGDAGRNASYAKCCDLVQCVKGNDCHEMSIPHRLVAFSAFFFLGRWEAPW